MALKKLLFVCKGGTRSLAASRQALRAGFSSVYNLSGGMLKWNKRGFPVLRARENTRQALQARG